MNKNILFKLSIICLGIFFVISCGSGHRKYNNGDGKMPEDSVSDTIKISKVTFFIENSGSMYGYVSKPNNYKNTIVALSYYSEFDNAKKEFYFINGKNNTLKKTVISINHIGNDPEVIKNNLNQSSYKKYGDPNNSDLTWMFEKALSSAKGGEISILISDCIYDVGEESDPLTALKIETEKTKQVFRDRLSSENIQTIIIKAESQFDGNYCFASKKGNESINQKRPYYIIIFGDSKLLNKHFTEDNISKNIAGYVYMARFMKIDNLKIPYQATNQNSKGIFKFDKSNKNKLINAEKDRNGQGFQFSIAVDFSDLPFPDNYYKTKENYKLNNNYKIIDIETLSNNIPGVTNFVPSHLITISTSSNPNGNIELVLQYNIPTWLTQTNSDDENNIKDDSTHTFGFKNLTEAITEAYQYKNKQNVISTFNFEIQGNSNSYNWVIYLIILIVVVVVTFIIYHNKNSRI